MGFLNNLFKPKYKHSDYNVRQQAVQELTDENILTEIAYNDEVSIVRHEAVKKITNQQVLIDILKTDRDKWVCLEAVEKITDNTVLSDVAETHFNDDVRLKAAIKSNNQKALMDLLLKYEDVKYTMNEDYFDALELITDEEKITKIAYQARNKCLRIEAIKRISNQDTLMDIAVYEKDSKIREKATQQVEDKELLSEKIKEKDRIEKEREKYYNVDLAKNNKYYYNREDAIKQINDEELLEDIIFNSEYSDSRSMAAKKINNEKILIKLAKESDDEWVRKIAITKINDQEVLKDLLQDEKNNMVFMEILKKINNQKELQKPIMDMYHELDRLSTRDFVRIINDEEILCSIAKEERDWGSVSYIASNINDEETLEYIALSHYSYGGTTYHQPNLAAIDKIKNPDVLMRIYEKTDDNENKVTLAEKLKELNYIEDESLNQAKKIMEHEALNNRIEQLKLDIAYADSNCSSDCIELAKIYEQQGRTVDAKTYYERAIKEIDIIINSTRGNKQYWIDEKRNIEEQLKKL